MFWPSRELCRGPEDLFPSPEDLFPSPEDLFPSPEDLFPSPGYRFPSPKDLWDQVSTSRRPLREVLSRVLASGRPLRSDFRLLDVLSEGPGHGFEQGLDSGDL